MNEQNETKLFCDIFVF